ncbi:MAG: TIM barrel protein [Clostridia bacterium]|nr:TIM barrel protein [Clostridia bacterium]
MVKFGPSGNCKSFYEAGYKHSKDAAKWLSEIGLDHYEYSFGKGIILSEATALVIGEEMRKYNISISVHAPYYINFATPTDEMADKSIMYVVNSIEKLKLLGGDRVVVHPASCGKMTREKAVQLTKERLVKLYEVLKEKGLDDVYICLETMGKQAQIGTYQEIIDFCKIAPNYIPTFDFGHINALGQGCLKTKEDYLNIFKLAIKEIGFEKVDKCHIHFSKIEYSAKGEVKHLTLEDQLYGPEFKPLAEAIKELNLNPIVVCESKEVMALDALEMKKIYNSI